VNGISNTADGAVALTSSTSGGYNTAIGCAAMNANLSGGENTAIGFNALSQNTGGNQNVATGYETLYENETGDNNTAVGYQALFSNTANDNTAIGNQALLNNAADDNTAAGFDALAANVNGISNVAMGTDSLPANEGSYNTSIGANAALNSRSVSQNTGVGFAALYNCTGNNNVALGYLAGENVKSGVNNIEIGNVGNISDTSTIRIGSGQSSAIIAGIYGVTTASSAEYVIVDPTGKLGTASTGSVTFNDQATRDAIARLNARNSDLEASNAILKATVTQLRKDFQATIAKQQQKNEELTASLKEQASLLQRVSAQMQVMRAAPQVVSNN